tara:strand:+ start:97 stop:402 length:306 start_codon:yes stop_codon:yes gene_type:complete
VSNDAPKSAVELVMERLRQQDAATEATQPLTDDQKARIADAKRDHDAKVAEAEILFGTKIAATFEPEARAELEANHRRDLSQFASTRDKKVAAIRGEQVDL